MKIEYVEKFTIQQLDRWHVAVGFLTWDGEKITTVLTVSQFMNLFEDILKGLKKK